ncbi:MAG: hypothetical protein J7598_24500 [Mitsuaria chitosanitabida]|uniref:hypothetical protein n=1 Tax=Roseateles chitosanitabidus TaxID=65048 RepID=UPI001B04E660|nr:hypothetical protein [Roseateles chitosanitabidus]MBO9689774.1 hypothetical protein [Roseateles chitosanitabidus]
MNLLLDSSSAVPYFTDVGATLRAIGVSASEFDWYVSDVDTNFKPAGLSWSDHWMTGPELAAVLSHADLQFNWAVFSAFPRGTRIDVVEAPSADGNPEFWRDDGTLRPQLKDASFELVCWDSSATILIGISESQAARFCRAYPEAKPLRSVAEPS